MEGALLAGKALADHARVLVDEDFGRRRHGARTNGRGGRGKDTLQHACVSERKSEWKKEREKRKN